MWELDCEESWVPKNWCFQTMVLEKILQSPLDSKVIKPVNPKGNQPWIYSLEGLILKLQYFGHLMWRTDSLEKTLMLGKTEGERRRGGTSEDEMAEWHHWLNGHEFGRGLTCYSLWGKSQTWLSNWTTTNCFLFNYLVVFIQHLLSTVDRTLFWSS